MSIDERIMSLMEESELSPTEFERRCGLSVGFMYKLKKGSKPTKKSLQGIVEAFPEIRRDWLFLGSGDKYTSAARAKTDKSESFGIPYYKADFGGLWRHKMDGATLQSDDRIYIPNVTSCKDSFACDVTGHAMEPQICHGDIVVMRPLAEWGDIEFGRVYALGTDTFGTVRIVTASKIADAWHLVPINPDRSIFAEQDIPKSKIKQLYVVTGWCRKA